MPEVHQHHSYRDLNQSDETKCILQGQHTGTVHLVEGRTPSEEEAQEIIHQLRVHSQEVDKLNTGNSDDFITSNNQVQMHHTQSHFSSDPRQIIL